MKLFNFFKNKENTTFQLTDQDRIWVEENFQWLINVFGYPYRESNQFLITKNYFPTTFNGDVVLIENIIKDLCLLHQIQEKKISVEVIKDLRDTNGVPYVIDGVPFELTLEIGENGYKIYVPNSLLNYSKRLIYSLIHEFIKIKLTDNKLQYDTGKETDLFIYLAGVYFGFGVIFYQNLNETVRETDGIWETKWNYSSQMPREIMAFALATFSKLIEQDSPKWKDNLPKDLKKQFELAMNYLTVNPTQLYDKNELKANDLFIEADQLYIQNEFEKAISNLQSILTLTKDESLKAEVYNNLGYFNVRLKNYKEGVTYFKNSIQILPDYGYALDNLGYALIQLGDLEEGKKYLEQAMSTDNNDDAYTYRNLALYFQRKSDMKQAESYFKKSFDTMTNSVDLLELHYAEFLISIGKNTEAIEFFKKAVEKGEPEAIEKWKEMEG
jgi:Tfp pilus assembly protein PilF